MNLITPIRSEFVSHVASLLDSKATDETEEIKKIFSIVCQPTMVDAPGPIENKLTQIIDLSGNAVSKKALLLYETLLKNINTIKIDDIQGHLLKQSLGLNNWITCKIYCREQAVDQYARLVLNTLGISWYFSNPTEVLLSHIFRVLVRNSTAVEQQTLLEKYRPEETILIKTQSYSQIAFEKTAFVGSYLILALSIPTSLYAGYKVYNLSHYFLKKGQFEYLPRSANFLINNVPSKVIRTTSNVAAWFYNLQPVFFFAALIVNYTSLSNYSIIQIPINSINYIIRLPAKIIEKIKDIPLYAFGKIINYVLDTGTHAYSTLQNGSTWSEKFRSAYELRRAEKIWVHQVMNLKNDKRDKNKQAL